MGREGNKETAGIADSDSVKQMRMSGSGGFLSRLWKAVFRPHGDDFEKRLQHISKEEAAVLARINRRSRTRRNIIRHLIVFSVLLEVIAVGYAIMTTRSMDLNWKMRSFRVLPMFLLPALSSLAYSAFVRFTRMCDRRDQNTLERLRAERQAKIDELKEKTNYYTTQQLIQRYDPDPAAKAAAATVLASKLGADSGLKVYLGDESKPTTPKGKSNDVEFVQGSGLRNRKQVLTRSSSVGSTLVQHSGEEMPLSVQSEGPLTSEHNQLVVEHYTPQAYTVYDGGWFARIAALLVGEDPTQSYALICGNCHMHNGLARKEDFPFITYYCPHCRALNQPKQLEEHVSGPSSPNLSTLRKGTGGSAEHISNAGDSRSDDSMLASNSCDGGGCEIEEVTETIASREVTS
ncbi:integral membrane metal-binding family protein [Salix suchowensis]|nr:integral membrane metal-binding family protein [Salix suchowensis]